jgi:aminoglycoside phosphotransferase (APT) family kinase protein
MGEIDIAELSARVRRALSGEHPTVAVGDVKRVHGGASSLSFEVRLTGGPVDRAVVKVAPPRLEPVRNRDVLRQAKILRVLRQAPGVAVPEVLATDPGEPPDRPPLYVMTYARGECFEPVSDEGTPPHPSEVAGRAREAAAMLARLHEFDSAGSISEETVYSSRQEVTRWIRAFESVSDDDIRPTLAGECGDRLLASIPEARRPVVTHGDYRLGNMLCESTTVNAIIDWEIWSLNDPRIDLAWFLLMCDSDRPALLIRHDVGMPPPSELMSIYEGTAGNSVADMNWYGALARFKQAAASALIVKHNRRSTAPNERALRFAGLVAPLLRAALEFL